MKAATSTTFVAVLLAACAQSGREPPRPAGQPAAAPPSAAPTTLAPLRLAEGSFAFADSTGTSLLALSSLADPRAVRAAICPGGEMHEATYARTQRRTAADNGRQTSENFDNQEGDVFDVRGGRVDPEHTCYLTSDSVLAASVVPVREGAPASCDPSWNPRVASARSRTVERCWPLATATGGLAVFAVQFATIDTSALASIVALEDGRFSFDDLPATYTGPDNDLWRADDAGQFSPSGFRVLLVSRVRGVLVVGLTWAGAEGDNGYLLAADSSGSFRTMTHSYRYWVPE